MPFLPCSGQPHAVPTIARRLEWHSRQAAPCRPWIALTMDIVSPARRSAMMAGIRGRDTKPEFAVRRMAHSMGYRYRLHRRDLPGSPDLVFPSRRKVIFVHGCFWHRHPGCRFAYNPKSNTVFWQAKFDRNVQRDAEAQQKLEGLGWDVLTIWECETRDTENLRATLEQFLGHARR